MVAVPQDFPQPRLNRAVPSTMQPAGGGPAVAVEIPQTRIFNFQVEVSTQNRASVAVSDRYRGPIIVLDASWFSLATAAPLPPGVVKIYCSDDDSGARTDSATLTVPSGKSIFDELQYSTPGAVPTQLDGFTLSGSQLASVHHRHHRLGYYPGPGDKFLKIMILSSTGGVGQFDIGGFIRVLEGVPEHLIAGFL